MENFKAGIRQKNIKIALLDISWMHGTSLYSNFQFEREITIFYLSYWLGLKKPYRRKELTIVRKADTAAGRCIVWYNF